ncbi:MAG TPA: hypothetical protein PLB59_09755 [Bacteroidales bacterium]|nr:hypothetical protein [Bacteroidales bacterium]HQN16675.1 hypothetical protein [Bacteroidales bacterium]HQP16242.1 hypothetical protein [Bacteroidales bacterium]
MKTKLPNIIIFLIVAVLLIGAVYLIFRTKESINRNKSMEAGNWFTNLFKSSES